MTDACESDPKASYAAYLDGGSMIFVHHSSVLDRRFLATHSLHSRDGEKDPRRFINVFDGGGGVVHLQQCNVQLGRAI